MKSSAATIIAKKLHGAGCRHAFGMPGGEVLLVMRALNDNGIEFNLCKHENSAGFMAEGSYHATGAPGILLTTIGPGLANGLNSVANALQEQVPLIVLSGCITDDETASFTHQVIDQTALMTPITKAQFQIGRGNAAVIMDKAIAMAIADPPGPVHVDVPHNLAGVELEWNDVPRVSSVAGSWQAGAQLDQAAQMLSRAKRPMVIAGLGALHHDAGDAIKALCEKFNAPLVTTYKAKGIVDENHPLCLGGHGLSPLSDTLILPLLAKSDCIILAGYDPIEMRSGWIRPWNDNQAIDIIHADIQHGMHGAAVQYIGNVAQGIESLTELASSSGDQWHAGEIQSARNDLDVMFADRTEWGPHQVFASLQERLPGHCAVTADSGAHRILISQMWKCERPQTLLQSSAFCTMGISLPLAIGYACTKSDKNASSSVATVAIVGDAGLDMVIGELATLRDMARHKQVAVVVIVLVDHSLALIELKQSKSNLPQLGVEFGETDFVAVAQAYGGAGYNATCKDTFNENLDIAMQSNGLSLIACHIDKKHYKGAF